MQVVIDIPENEYRLIKEIYEKNDIVESTYSYIYYGTPLPKGHGDLIDLDKMCDDYWDGNYMEIHRDDLPNIPIIIKSDKESE